MCRCGVVAKALLRKPRCSRAVAERSEVEKDLRGMLMLLLGGQRVVPKRLLDEGFVFGFSELRAALEKNPKSLPIILCLADLRDSIQGRYAEAEASYREAAGYAYLNRTIEATSLWIRLARNALDHADALYKREDFEGAKARYEIIVTTGGGVPDSFLYQTAALNEPATEARQLIAGITSRPLPRINHAISHIVLTAGSRLAQLAQGLDFFGLLLTPIIVDSLGTEQVIAPGQLNLMTAGHGVAHSEEGTGSYRGELHGVQLWVAQPDHTRRGLPAFEHHAELPHLELDHGIATVLIGDVAGVASPARRDTDHAGIDLDLSTGANTIPLRADYEHALVVLAGTLAAVAVVTPAARAQAKPGLLLSTIAAEPEDKAAGEIEVGEVFLVSLGGKLYDDLWLVLDQAPPAAVDYEASAADGENAALAQGEVGLRNVQHRRSPPMRKPCARPSS